MGFRFRRSLSIFPGFKINLSKSGVSATLGVPGANVNLNKDGLRGTVGVPGSGLSYQTSRVGYDEALKPPTEPTLALPPQQAQEQIEAPVTQVTEAPKLSLWERLKAAGRVLMGRR
jgi:hypothetical protein